MVERSLRSEFLALWLSAAQREGTDEGSERLRTSAELAAWLGAVTLLAALACGLLGAAREALFLVVVASACTLTLAALRRAGAFTSLAPHLLQVSLITLASTGIVVDSQVPLAVLAWSIVMLAVGTSTMAFAAALSWAGIGAMALSWLAWQRNLVGWGSELWWTHATDRVAMAVVAGLLVLTQNREREVRRRVAGEKALQQALSAAMERELLDFLRQGVLAVDLAGNLLTWRSSCIEGWFGPIPDKSTLWGYVESADSGLAERWAVLWPQWSVSQGAGARMRWATNHLPQRATVNGRTYRFDYRPFSLDGRLHCILVGISDISESLAAMEAEEEQNDLIQLFGQLATDAGAVRAFFVETQQEIARLVHEPRIDVQRGGLAALGAEFSVAGLVRLASAARKLEHALSGRQAPLAPDAFKTLEQRWQALSRKVLPLLLTCDDHLTIDLDEYSAALVWAQQRGADQELVRVLASWTSEPLARHFARLALHSQAIAATRGKAPLQVLMDSAGLRLPVPLVRAVWRPLADLTTWMIDALLPAVQAGDAKPNATLALMARVHADSMRLELRLDGCNLGQTEPLTIVEDPTQSFGRFVDEQPLVIEALTAVSSDLTAALRVWRAQLTLEIPHPGSVRVSCVLPRALDPALSLEPSGLQNPRSVA